MVPPPLLVPPNRLCPPPFLPMRRLGLLSPAANGGSSAPLPSSFPPPESQAVQWAAAAAAAGPILPDREPTHLPPFLVGLLSLLHLPSGAKTNSALSLFLLRSANMVDECLKSWPVPLPLSLKRARPLPALRPTATGLREVEGGRERERERGVPAIEAVSLSARPSLWVNQRGRSVGAEWKSSCLATALSRAG